MSKWPQPPYKDIPIAHGVKIGEKCRAYGQFLNRTYPVTPITA